MKMRDGEVKEVLQILASLKNKAIHGFYEYYSGE